MNIKRLRREIHRYSNRMKRSMDYIDNHPLTKSSKIAAYLRYFSLHVSQYFTRTKTKEFQFAEGLKYLASMDDAGIVANYYTGLADFEEMSFLLHYLREDDLFIDVGANVGAYSLLAAGVNKCKTLAIEPIPFTYEKLIKNINLNALNMKVECLNAGLGSKEGILNFSLTPFSDMNHVANSTDVTDTQKVSVKCFPLDSLILSKGTPSLIKIDVEGYEMEVLKGASTCLQDMRCNAIIIEINGSGIKFGFQDEQVFTLLSSFGFVPYQYEPLKRHYSRLKSWNTDQFNTIFIRDLNSAMARTQAAPKRKILTQWV